MINKIQKKIPYFVIFFVGYIIMKTFWKTDLGVYNEWKVLMEIFIGISLLCVIIGIYLANKNREMVEECE